MTDTLTHALTIRHPFAYATAAGWKPIENKTERPPLALIGQLVGIHAGLQWARESDLPSWAKSYEMPAPTDSRLVYGALIGVARLVGPVRRNEAGRFKPRSRALRQRSRSPPGGNVRPHPPLVAGPLGMAPRKGSAVAGADPHERTAGIVARPVAHWRDRDGLDGLCAAGRSGSGAVAEGEGDAMSECVVILDRPKTPANVGTVFRSALALGAGAVILCGPRWKLDSAPLHNLRTDPSSAYRHLDVRVVESLEEGLAQAPQSLVVIERGLSAPSFLDAYSHPECAAYVFGPEDSGVSVRAIPPMRSYDVVEIRGAAQLAHPLQGCLNLATSVSLVLYDRAAKRLRSEP